MRRTRKYATLHASQSLPAMSPNEANAIALKIQEYQEKREYSKIQRLTRELAEAGYLVPISEINSGGSAVSGPMSDCVSGVLDAQENYKYDKNLPTFKKIIKFLRKRKLYVVDQVSTEEQKAFMEIMPDHPEHFKMWGELMRTDLYLFTQSGVRRLLFTPPALTRKGGKRTWDSSSGAIVEALVAYALGYDFYQTIECSGKTGEPYYSFIRLDRNEVLKTIINSSTFENYRGKGKVEDVRRGAEPLPGDQAPDQRKVRIPAGPPYFIVGESDASKVIKVDFINKRRIPEYATWDQFCKRTGEIDLKDAESDIELRKRGVHCSMDAQTMILAPDWYKYAHSVVYVMSGIRLGHSFIQAKWEGDHWTYRQLDKEEGPKELMAKIKEMEFLENLPKKARGFITPDRWIEADQKNGFHKKVSNGNNGKT